MSFFPASRKARLAIALSAVPAVLAIGFLTVYLFVQSSSFKGYLSRNLTSLLGEHIDIGQEIRISRIFPRLSVVLPNVKIRPTSLGSTVERIRVDGFALTVSPNVLFSGGERGDIDVHVKEATLLSSTANLPLSSNRKSLEAQASRHSGDEDSTDAVIRPLSNSPTGDKALVDSEVLRSLSAFLQNTTSLHSTFTADRIVYIVRDAESGSRRYDLTQFSLSAKQQSIRLTARIDAEGLTRRTVNASFSKVEDSAGPNNEVVLGQLLLELSAEPDGEEARKNTPENPPMDTRRESDEDQPSELHRLTTPVSIAARRIELESVEYTSPVGWIRGTVSVDTDSGQADIQADLEVRKLQLSLAKTPVGSSQAHSPENDAQRLFPFTPFTVGVPEDITARIGVHLGAVRLDSTPIINGQLQLTMDGGEARLRTENLTLLGGPSEFSGVMSFPEQGLASVRMKFEADDMQLNRLRTPETGEPILNKGKADLIMALRGSGPSPGHIASSSNGYFMATIDSAEVNQKYSTAIDRGVVSWGLERIAVLTSDDESKRALSRLSDPLQVPCASIKLYLNDGRAEVSNGLIVELPQNTLYSSGFVNLYDESLGFAFRARNKSMFDWSAISIARFAEISGTLADPSVTLNKNELAKQGILSTTTIMWGPLPSLVYTLAESGVKNSRTRQCRPSIE